MSRRSLPVPELFEVAVGGDRAALARLLSLVERGGDERGGGGVEEVAPGEEEARAAEEERASLNESITLRQGAQGQSHTAGFEAWLRSRGDIKARARACVSVRSPSQR